MAGPGPPLIDLGDNNLSNNDNTNRYKINVKRLSFKSMLLEAINSNLDIKQRVALLKYLMTVILFFAFINFVAAGTISLNSINNNNNNKSLMFAKDVLFVASIFYSAISAFMVYTLCHIIF